MKNYSIKPFVKKIKKPWGWETVFTEPKSPYTGKIIFVRRGARLSLQYHDQKEETICLLWGKAEIWLEDNQGKIRRLPMEVEKGYRIKRKQKHRLVALEESCFLEVSQPEKGTTYRLEDDYGRSNETK